MSTVLTYIALLLVIGVLYGLTRPKNRSQGAPWLTKFLPQNKAPEQQSQSKQILRAADPSEVARVLEDIYSEFSTKVLQLQDEMDTKLNALQARSEQSWQAIRDEVEQLQQLHMHLRVGREQVDVSVQETSENKQVLTRENKKAAIEESDVTVTQTAEGPLAVAGHTIFGSGLDGVAVEELDARYFGILDELVQGTDPVLICHRLGVNLSQVDLVRRLMTHPFETPQ